MTSSAERSGIAAIVVTHESASSIDDCLMRLRVAHGVHEIRVVDNASTDDTMEIVQRHALQDARVRFIANPDNPGFAVGCNQGARDTDAPWLAFVNPDLMVEADTLSRLRARQPELSVEIVEDTSARLLSLIDQGRLVAVGTHRQLIEDSPLYARLAALQFTTG